MSSIVSNEKSAFNLIENPLYIIGLFYIAIFKIISLYFDSLTIMCLSVDVLSLLYLNLLSFLDFKNNIFFCHFYLGTFQSLFLQIFFLLLSPLLLGLPLCMYWDAGWYPTDVWGSVDFSLLFLLLISDNLSWPVFISLSSS